MNPPSFPFGYSHELLESILNVGTDCICVKDPDGRYVYVNDLHASLYEAKPQDMLGKTAEPWVGKAQFEKWNQEDLAIIKVGRSKHFEPYSLTVKDGQAGSTRGLVLSSSFPRLRAGNRQARRLFPCRKRILKAKLCFW